MEFLSDLWLPILLQAVFVFIASSIIHMATPLHKSDYTPMPNEGPVLEAMRNAGVKPGSHYMFPGCTSMKDYKDPAMIEKYNLGPVGFMTIMPNGMINMGKNLAMWFIYSLIVGVFIAYVARLALPDSTPYMQVFRVTGTVAFMTYGLANFVDSVWKAQRWSITLKHMFDGLVYCLVAAGTFAWLWPGV